MSEKEKTPKSTKSEQKPLINSRDAELTPEISPYTDLIAVEGLVELPQQRTTQGLRRNAILKMQKNVGNSNVGRWLVNRNQTSQTPDENRSARTMLDRSGSWNGTAIGNPLTSEIKHHTAQSGSIHLIQRGGNGEGGDEGGIKIDFTSKINREIDISITWIETIEHPLIKAYHSRRMLLLDSVEPFFYDEDEADKFIMKCEETALSEENTLAQIEGEEENTPEAFPKTWAERVDDLLTLDVVLNNLLEEANRASEMLAEIAKIIPSEILEEGLPVDYEEALTLETFDIDPKYIDFASEHIVKSFVISAKDFMFATANYNFYKKWEDAKEKIVGSIRVGEYEVDPISFEKLEAFVKQSKSIEKRFESTLKETSFDALADEEIDLPEVEGFLALGSAFLSIQDMFYSWKLAKILFAWKLSDVDAQISGESGSERFDRALDWAVKRGYFDEARRQEIEDLFNSLGSLLLQAGSLVIAQYIPFLNIAFDIYLAYELADMMAEVKEVMDKVESANSAVALQRASAHLAKVFNLEFISKLLLLTGRIIRRKSPAGAKKTGEETSDHGAGKAGPSEKIYWGNWDDYPKIMIDGQKCALIAGRPYSREAVDRMQPSGMRYRGGNSGGMPEIRQTGGTYPSAEKGKAYGRSVAPAYVEEVIRNTIPSIQKNGNLAYQLGTVKVIVSPKDVVVTIITD